MRMPGSWTIGRLWGVPIRLHWSVLVFPFVLSGFRFLPGAWLAMLLLVLIHEVGHALVVKVVGARPVAIDVFGYGGLCHWDGPATPIGRACIAWGGIWAQLVVFALVAAGVFVFGAPSRSFVAQMVDAALTSNLWMIAFNLLPVAPLDGKEAWPLFPLLARRFRARRAASASRARGQLPRDLTSLLDAPRPMSAQRPASPPARRSPVIGSPLPTLRAPHLDRKEIESPSRNPLDEIDERDFTPEVEDVLDQMRAIVSRAATEPTNPTASPDDAPTSTKHDRPPRP